MDDLALTILDDMLMGNTAAPLHRILDGSGFGESVIGGGLDDTLRQRTFTAGLKNVREVRLGRCWRTGHQRVAPLWGSGGGGGGGWGGVPHPS